MGIKCTKHEQDSGISQLADKDHVLVNESPLAGLECAARIALKKDGEWDVHDGDTFRVCVYVPLERLNTLTCGTGGIFIKLNIRLHGLDAVELKSTNGNIARQILIDKLKISDGLVVVHVSNVKEKFGRTLAIVYTPGNDKKSINEQLMSEYPAYFKSYSGRGTRPF